jgi:hypothetical protein
LILYYAFEISLIVMILGPRRGFLLIFITFATGNIFQF